MTPSHSSDDDLRLVRAWLLALWAAVWLMVVVGGVTRLTGSGLSIVKWQPVSGVLPPLSEHAWRETFAAYQSSPQYKLENQWMSLADFQRIFFWEYVHRLWGRLLGVASIVPWLWLVLRKRLQGARARRAASIFVLGGLQGLVGWYMVKSGLVNEPRVSHYRLALHLVLGMGVGLWTLWQALDASAALHAGTAPPVARLPRSVRMLVAGLVPLLGLQVVYGAFMAGLHAGYVSSTFPDMNGRYLPGAFFFAGGAWQAALGNPLAVHYLHRALALLVTVYVGVLSYRLRAASRPVRVACAGVLVATIVQVALGASTVVLHVPTLLAALHQAGAYLLVSAAVVLWHAVAQETEAHDDRQARDRDGGLTGSRQDLRRA